MTKSEANSSSSIADRPPAGDGTFLPCTTCAGRGWHWDWVSLVVLSIIALVLMWSGWHFIQRSIQNTTVGNIEFAIAFSLGGPALLIYAWWKASRSDCETCEGTGLVNSGEPQDIDPQDLAIYLVQHYAHLLTEQERLIERAIRTRQKHAGMELDRPIDMSIPATRKALEKWGLIDNDEINRLLADGPDRFRNSVVERIMREHADEIVINRCPMCRGLTPTPHARQCFRCHHDWHMESACVQSGQ